MNDSPADQQHHLDLRALLRTELTRAMKHRDRLAANALRSAIGAIDNAESVPEVEAASPGEGLIAGSTVGLGATEAPRRDLTPGGARAVVKGEIAQRRDAADEVDAAGRPDRATDLRREADVLESVLGADPAP